MRLSAVVVVVVVLAVFLAADTEANWVSRTFRKVGNIVKETARTQAVKGIGNVIKTGLPMVVRLLGKRSVDASFLGTINDEKAKELVNALEMACLAFTNSEGARELTNDDVQIAFGISDGNEDKSLNRDEFDLFENTVEAVRHCWDSLKNKGK